MSPFVAHESPWRPVSRTRITRSKYHLTELPGNLIICDLKLISLKNKLFSDAFVFQRKISLVFQICVSKHSQFPGSFLIYKSPISALFQAFYNWHPDASGNFAHACEEGKVGKGASGVQVVTKTLPGLILPSANKQHHFVTHWHLGFDLHTDTGRPVQVG